MEEGNLNSLHGAYNSLDDESFVDEGGGVICRVLLRASADASVLRLGSWKWSSGGSGRRTDTKALMPRIKAQMWGSRSGG